MKKINNHLATLILIIFVTLTGCLQEEAIVFPPPKANFDFNASNALPKSTIAFSNSSVNASTYMWTIQQGRLDTDQTPLKTSKEEDIEYTFDSAGSYIVTLIATNKQGAANAISKEVIVKQSE